MLQYLAIPEVGLGAVFVVAFVSATLVPVGSEPAVFGLVKLQPDMFWPAVLVATLGNTLGGGVSWWMGWAAKRTSDRLRHARGAGSEVDMPAGHSGAAHLRALAWLQRHGAKACLLSWLPVVGDPLCAVAGWLRLPFWPCLLYMGVGKLMRYITMTGFLLYVT